MFVSRREWTIFLFKGAHELPDKTFKLVSDILSMKITFNSDFQVASVKSSRFLF